MLKNRNHKLTIHKKIANNITPWLWVPPAGLLRADRVAVRLWLDSVLSDERSTYFIYHVNYNHDQIIKLSLNYLQLHRSWMNNPGVTLNKLHSQFSAKLEQDCLKDFVCARELGATFSTKHHGFHNRNEMVAQSDYLIAFTWGESTSEP